MNVASMNRFAVARCILLARQGGRRYSRIMRRFRTFFLFVLAIALPLQGYAQFALPGMPCPMEQTATMEGSDAAAHDCCNDADSAAKTCKSGQACQSAGSLLPVTGLGDLPRVVATSARFPRLADITSSFDPAATWRPPAQL
ncbi:MAG: hypothetical protein B7X93_06185 [Hydrogenophilales bacterium 17-61-9]|nr:MAG: hypothetical protein B7X93_06185 [Hydrogenophilales bacterium 17-61-9]